MTNADGQRSPRRRRIAAWSRPIAAALLVSGLGCSSTTTAPPGDARPASTTAPGTTAPGTTAGTSPGNRVSVAPAATDITDLEMTTTAPDGTTLVFDAIAAGDPAAAGAGKLVLLLHGFPETDEAWREQLQPLAAAGYYAVAPNQRGYSAGARPAAVEAYAVPNLIADVLAMATALGAEQFHVVGHDWGSVVAWGVAGVAPERVRSLVALSVPHPDAFADAFTNPDGEQTRKSRYIQVFAAPNSEVQFVENDANGLRIIYGKAISEEKIGAYLRVLGTKEALGAALNWYRANNVRAAARLGVVHVPTLFVWSTDDVAIARSGADATKDFVDGPYRYEVLEGISHWIPEEVPDRVRDLLLAHLASVP